MIGKLVEAWKYYIDVFNMDIRILEDDKVTGIDAPTPWKATKRQKPSTNMQRRLRNHSIRTQTQYLKFRQVI